MNIINCNMTIIKESLIESLMPGLSSATAHSYTCGSGVLTHRSLVNLHLHIWIGSLVNQQLHTWIGSFDCLVNLQLHIWVGSLVNLQLHIWIGSLSGNLIWK